MVTVTVTLHDPAFKPFTEVFTTWQTLCEEGATTAETFEVFALVSFAKVASAVNEEVLEIAKVFFAAGAFIFKLGFGAEKCFKLKSTTTPPEAAAKVSICGTSTAAAEPVFSKIVPVKTLEGFAINVATSAAETAPPACDIDTAIIAKGTYILKNAGFNDFPFSCASPGTPKSAGT